MFFPVSTDAPVYYWPFATVGLIVANVIAFGITGPWMPEYDSGWLLTHGNGLRPGEWVLSAFAHADFGHLLGNLFFLWVFGLVVEGKLGWLRFLACYLSIGVGENAIEQAAMLGYDGEFPSASLGASTAIYGVMAMAAVWAPKNDIMFVYWFGLFAGTFDIAIGLLAVIYIGLDFLGLVLSGGSMGTNLLHVAGAAIGFPLGIVMLKRNIVDCEGWDMFHVWSGDYGATSERTEKDAKLCKRLDERRKKKAEELAEAGREQVHVYLEGGNSAAAEKLMDKLSETGTDLRLDPDDLAALIRAMHKAKRWAKSAPLMAKLIKLRPERADPVRLKLAQICVVELGRPGRALDLLGEIDLDALPDDHRRLASKIAQRSQEMQAEGHVELDDGKW